MSIDRMTERQGHTPTVYRGINRIFSKANKATLEETKGAQSEALCEGLTLAMNWPWQVKEEGAEISLSEHTALS